MLHKNPSNNLQAENRRYRPLSYWVDSPEGWNKYKSRDAMISALNTERHSFITTMYNAQKLTVAADCVFSLSLPLCKQMRAPLEKDNSTQMQFPQSFHATIFFPSET